jgi:hypothetical protein
VTTTRVLLDVPNEAIDKIDMLFDIDNSASMGDKQTFLARAIPDLIDRLVDPNCVDDNGLPANPVVKSSAGCPAAYKPEFARVHDMHLGIVTSALGSRLSGTPPVDTSRYAVLCADPSPLETPPEYKGLATHNDDQGHLISRSLQLTATSATEGTVVDAAAGYLYWFPTGTSADNATPLTIEGTGAAAGAGTLKGDLAELVNGAGVFGCGIESQLESWYRFLVQPDPYASLVLVPPAAGCVGCQAKAQWSGVDTVLLQQRHDFLRPDSLVVVVVLSDENDSEVDVRADDGTAYLFMHADWAPPVAMASCAADPADMACGPCPQGADAGDATCQAKPAYPPSAANDWGYDPNLRHVHMKAKYGVDPQYPIGRYVLGLTSTAVPNRADEYPTDAKHPNGSRDYVGCTTDDQGNCAPKCTNPLFAATLPEGNTPLDDAHLCHLPLGPRAAQKANIFFAHIGGVPHQLLHFDPNNLAASQLQPADWVRILGQGAANYKVGDDYNYDYTGIDPHMIESVEPRTATSVKVDTAGTNAVAPANGPSTDPVNGREWTTNLPFANGAWAPHVQPVDLQYACTFPLDQPRDCTRDDNEGECDCPRTAAGLTADEVPPLCDPQTPTLQKYAKAYPTTRELLLAKLMGPKQGIVASLCPEETVNTTSPVYGYRPAVAVIVDRLKAALRNQCLPHRLGQADPVTGGVPCLALVSLPPAGDGATCKRPNCPAAMGLLGPGAPTNSSATPPLDQSVLDEFCDAEEASYLLGGGAPGAPGDPASQSACMLLQLTESDPNAAGEFANGSCLGSDSPGWCYVTGVVANGCAQAVQFSAGARGALPSGSSTHLQCSEDKATVTPL